MQHDPWPPTCAACDAPHPDPLEPDPASVMWTCACGTGNYWAGGRSVAVAAPAEETPAGT